MIKFDYLIHKDTGIVITYEKWLEILKNQYNEGVRIPSLVFSSVEGILGEKDFVRKFVFEGNESDMLVSDEFEVVNRGIKLNRDEIKHFIYLLSRFIGYPGGEELKAIRDILIKYDEELRLDHMYKESGSVRRW